MNFEWWSRVRPFHVAEWLFAVPIFQSLALVKIGPKNAPFSAKAAARRSASSRVVVRSTGSALPPARSTANGKTEQRLLRVFAVLVETPPEVYGRSLLVKQFSKRAGHLPGRIFRLR